ncbi:MAG: hypothetical protein JWP74_2434 [Marmoricola sp.]|nr:hypothetical protein [Marmoricola sp.]
MTIKGHARTWSATVTDVGTHYLEHDGYPPGYRTVATTQTRPRVDQRDESSRQALALGDGASKTMAEAQALITQLQDEGRVTINDPAKSTRAHYRRVLHACRVHALVPSGHELLFTGRDAGDIVIALSDGSAEATSDWLRIRTTSRRITTNLDAVRRAVEQTPEVLKVSDDLRDRAVEVVVRLADALRDHDLRLGVNTKLKTPKLYLQIDTKRRDVVLEEATKEVPHVLTPAEERESRRYGWKTYPKTDQVPSGNIRLKVARDKWNEFDEWVEAPGSRLKSRIGEIALAIKAGIVDDHDARERQLQAQQEASERWERQQAEERQAWEQLRAGAVKKAREAVRGSVVAETIDAWRQANELRAFCTSLEDALGAGTETDKPNVRRWIEWARAQADDLDPTRQIDRLDAIDFDVAPSDDDLRPFMDGWSPTGPQKDYSARSQQPDPQPVQRSPWHPGLRGKPSWWR